MENPPWRYSCECSCLNYNPGSTDECPFCFQRETIFHTFLYCSRLDSLFQVLTGIFNRFDRLFHWKCSFVVLNILRNTVSVANC